MATLVEQTGLVHGEEGDAMRDAGLVQYLERVGLLTSQQAEHVFQVQRDRQPHPELGELLLSLGLIKEEALTKEELAEKFNVSVTTIYRRITAMKSAAA